MLDVEGMADTVVRRGPRRGATFSVGAGEVVGLAGLVGAGRTELAMALFGRKGDSGRVRLDGRSVAFRRPSEAIAAGIGYLPEDRKEAGLFLDMSIEQNVGAVAARRFGTFWCRDRLRREAVEGLCRSMRVACRGPSTSRRAT